MSGLRLIAAFLLVFSALAKAQVPAPNAASNVVGSGIAGLWFDPSLDGEGFSVVESEAGVTLYFYGYDALGNPLWLVSDTVPSLMDLNAEAPAMVYRGAGGNFQGPVQQVVLDVWGTASVSLEDCGNAVFELSGPDGFKVSDAVRLAAVDGAYCSVRGESGKGAQYCEILLGFIGDAGATVEVWGTQFVDECPDERFSALDAEAIQAEYGADFIRMNGPRQGLADGGRFDSTGDVIRTYGDLRMARQATLLVSQEQLSAGGPYLENTVLRENVFELWAGSEIYRLTADDGKQYVMFSFAKTVDPDLSLERLPGLGAELSLPAGWRWEAVTLDEDLIIETRAEATVIQDDFENSYQLLTLDNEFRFSGLWFEPSRDGEGFNVIESESGTTIFYYGYDAAGEPLWLVSETTAERLGPGDASVLNAFRGEGGTFEAPTPGGDLDLWGTIITVATDCTTARFELSGSDGAKVSEAVKLAENEAASCADAEILETEEGVKFVRTPDSAFDNLPDWPYPPNFVEIDGLRQAYAEAGPATGEVVLLLHGQPSWSYLYRKMIPVLAEGGYRVIAMDHLGLGRSDKPIDVDAYTYIGHSDRLEKFIQALRLEDINLFVQDWGSLIGLRVAGLNPEWFASIAVGNGNLPDIPADFEPFPAVEDTDEVLVLASPYGAIPEQQMPFYEGCDLLFDQEDSSFFGNWMIYAMKGISFRPGDTLEALTWFELPAAEEAAYDAPFPSRLYMAGVRVFPSLINEVPGETQAALAGLTSFTRPFLTLWGANDAGLLGSCETQQFFIDNVPGAAGQAHDRLPEAGHFLQDDQGEEIARRLLEFYEANNVGG
ncbi:MAG: haloalkane dehalogenase [Pseudomonadota bacterium]